jgi:methionine-rich copper-binding protein CopC/prenyltransferase beta subunit
MVIKKSVSSRLCKGLLALALVVSLLLGGSRPVQAADYPLNNTDQRIQAALAYLKNPASDATLWTGGEKTCYTIVAVAACGDDPHTYVKDGQSLVDIIRNQAGVYLQPQASLAHEYYLLAIAAAGENPWNFNGVNVAGQLLEMFNGEQFGQTGIINDDFWAIIALVGAGVNPNHTKIQAARNFIITHQNGDGGWGCNTDGSGLTGGSDPCDTANAVMALIAAGESPQSAVIQQAFTYLHNMQNEDGGFPYSDQAGASDVASDARVMAAIRAAGGNPTSSEWTTSTSQNPFSQALSLQQPDGGFAWHAGESSHGWMTTYILPALVGKYWPTAIVTDNQPPVISSVTPADGSTTTAKTPAVTVNVSDNFSGLDNASLSLLLDGADITAQSTFVNGVVNYLPAADLAVGTHSLQLTLSDRAGNATNYAWNFVIQAASSGGFPGGGFGGLAPGDSTVPEINSYYPLDDEVIDSLKPEISIAFSDAASEINTSSVQVKIDGADVTAEAVITDSQLTYIPATELAAGSHTIVFSVSDSSGNNLTRTWSFTIEPPVIEPTATVTEAVSPTPDVPSGSLSGLASILDSDGRLTGDFQAASGDNKLELSLAPGTQARDALNQPLEDIIIDILENVPAPESGWSRIGYAYEISPDGATFDQPVQIVFRYTEIAGQESIRWDTNGDGSIDLLDGELTTTPEDFCIACWNPDTGKWEFLDSVVDRLDRTVTASTTHFSQYALLGPQALPLNITAIAISPEKITRGEEISISVTAENPGQGRGTYVIPLKIDGYLEDSREVTLNPGENTLVFLHNEPYAGRHTLEILGYSAEFTVDSAEANSSDHWWESVDVIFWAYIGGGVLCLAIIVVVIAVVTTRKKK